MGDFKYFLDAKEDEISTWNEYVFFFPIFGELIFIFILVSSEILKTHV